MHDEDQLGERRSWVDSVDIINVPQFKPIRTREKLLGNLTIYLLIFYYIC